jgi:hypothetical protein
MSLHHIRECIDEDIKWFSIIWMGGLFVRFDGFLESMDNLSGFACIMEDECLAAHELHYDIRYPDDGVDPRVCPDLHPFDLRKWDDDDIRGEYLPLQIDQSISGEDPYICIPIKYLVDEDEIYDKEICIYMPWNDHLLDMSKIKIVEKTWYKKGKKCPEDDILDDHKKMTMEDMLYFFVCSNIG